jgi:uncharacterized membrane protein (UPF0127 family)
MFSKKKNLMFVFGEEARRSLHMLFVFFPIDVLFLDKNKKIVEIKRDFRPFTFYKSKEKAQYIVEISTDLNKKYKIGEKIKF